MSSVPQPRDAARRVGLICARLFTLVPLLAHELAHALTAVPMADRVTIVLDDGKPRVGVDWHDEREVEIWLSKLAPVILGLVAALVVAWTWSQNPWQPQSIRETILAATLGIWWLIFSLPSGGDLRLP